MSPAGPLTGQKLSHDALGVAWIHGSESAKHNADPDLQVHWYDEHTVILRQNKAINYEAPFLFLLFGSDRALLIDTGATESSRFFPVRQVVDDLVGSWLVHHPRLGYELLVLHTHSHHDHVAGDPQFRDRPNTRLVAADLESVWGFLEIEDAEGARILDLGERELEVLPTPGHDAAAITYYDPWTGFLLTGDTVYPGRLYIEDWAAYSRTIDRLIDLTERRPVTHLLGCHIEMTREPGVDYPVRTTYQPQEPPLELAPSRLRAIRALLDEIGPTPARRAADDFILWPDE
jgi:glyoxylase-like metal-dependent hydrolase (beta-lactamase superfamily II)